MISDEQKMGRFRWEGASTLTRTRMILIGITTPIDKRMYIFFYKWRQLRRVKAKMGRQSPLGIRLQTRWGVLKTAGLDILRQWLLGSLAQAVVAREARGDWRCGWGLSGSARRTTSQGGPLCSSRWHTWSGYWIWTCIQGRELASPCHTHTPAGYLQIEKERTF